jgi:tRNA pseudouridine38-40 synthase
MTRRFKLTIAYDGTRYHGWQVQLVFPSVQQIIEMKIAQITGQETVKVHGSGRTDQGVHARGQVAHVDVTCRITPKALMCALNSCLPQDIRILNAVRAKPDFHARRSAAGKEYRYFVWNDALMLPDKWLYMAHACRPLDLSAMRDGAAAFVGRHDFTSFTANPQRAVESKVRTIFDFTVTKKGRAVCFRVSGEGFLYKQVRSMVGFLLRVGEGIEPPGAVGELLESHMPREARVPTAPPQGLFLWRVWYRQRHAALTGDAHDQVVV